ncbi:MAG: prephenate dehydrogenase/arogenate dehydrogenase family protein [Actinomycetota bacterium]
MSRKVAVVGTGLIGGSIGLAVRAADPGTAVTGFDPDERSAAGALDRGALTAIATTAAEAVAGADLVILALPVDRIPEMCDHLASHVPDDAVVTDVGSAKQEVVRRGVAGFGPRFVGGHPMAGSERHGVEAADADLFRESFWILTPTADTSSDAYGRVTELVTSTGARPVALQPDVHDALVAKLSHVPQLAASTLVDTVVRSGPREALLGLAGAGFRDVTRIAASNPDLWVAIVRANTRAVLEGLRGLEGRLEDVAAMIEDERWAELRSFLAQARAARLELFAKPEFGGEPLALSMVIPDHPGVLAEVTTAAGTLGVNIEDLRIMHSTEGGRGRLELIVAGEDAARRLHRRLTNLGYHVEERPID